MRLTQLRYFVKVVDCGGVNAAARELLISQPTISTAIRELEAELGVDLFRRVKQQMILTEEGSHFYSRIKPLLEELTLAADETRGLGRSKNLVRLGIPPMIGVFTTPPILTEFHRLHPEIQVQILESSTDDQKQLLLNDSVDAVLMIGESQYNVGLEQYALLHTRYAFYVGPDHPLAGRKQVDLRDLADEPLVLFEKGLYMNRLIQRAFQAEGKRPNVVLTTNQIGTIKEFVGRSVASTFLIREVVESRDSLVEVPTDLAPNITIVAAWKKGQNLTPAVLKLLKFLQKLNRK